MLLDIVKFFLAASVAGGLMVIIPLSCRWHKYSILIWLALFGFSCIADPITTADFHHGERHNVRGWEFCWPELIACGVLTHGVIVNKFQHFWLNSILSVWLLHLGLSSFPAWLA